MWGEGACEAAEHERRVLGVVGPLELDLGRVEQRRDGRVVPAVAHHRERREADLVGDVHLGAQLQERVRGRVVAVAQRDEQRCLPLVVRLVRVRVRVRDRIRVRVGVWVGRGVWDGIRVSVRVSVGPSACSSADWGIALSATPSFSPIALITPTCPKAAVGVRVRVRVRVRVGDWGSHLPEGGGGGEDIHPLVVDQVAARAPAHEQNDHVGVPGWVGVGVGVGVVAYLSACVS